MSEAPPQASTVHAFERLIEPLMAPAYRTALQFARNAADAEELVQDATVQAYRAFGSFREGTYFRAWFFKILTNLAIHRYRQKKRRPDSVSLDSAADTGLWEMARDEGAGPESQVFTKFDRERVSDALDALPDEFQTVCTLYLMEEFSYEEISEILGVPIGTVRSRLHRGRKLLQISLIGLAQEQGLLQ